MTAMLEPDWTIGDRIAKARRAVRPKMTEGALAELMGVTQIRVSRWENDITVPSVLELSRLAEILDAPHLKQTAKSQAELEIRRLTTEIERLSALVGGSSEPAGSLLRHAA